MPVGARHAVPRPNAAAQWERALSYQGEKIGRRRHIIQRRHAQRPVVMVVRVIFGEST